MNQVLLTGRIATEPRFTPTQNSKLCSYRLAVKRNFKTGEAEKTDFFSIIVWGGLAETCQKYLDLGREVSIKGRLRTRSYKKDEETHWITEVIADEVEFLGHKNNNQKPTGNSQEQLAIAQA